MERRFTHIKSGKYKIGNQLIFFRSKWEANYALYLEYLKNNGMIIKCFPSSHAFDKYVMKFRLFATYLATYKIPYC